MKKFVVIDLLTSKLKLVCNDFPLSCYLIWLSLMVQHRLNN